MNIREKIAAKLVDKKTETAVTKRTTAIYWQKIGTQSGKPAYEPPSLATVSVISKHFKALVLAKAPKAKIKIDYGMVTPWYTVYLIVSNVDDAFADKLKLKDSYNIKGIDLLAQPEILDPDDEGKYVYKKLGASPNDIVIAIYLETKEMAKPSKRTDKESNTNLRVVKPESKAGKKALSKIDAKKAATSTAKAPKGTGKLKSFMKENGIDLKTLKALVKHITPSK